MSETGSLDQPYRFSTKRYYDGVGVNYYGYRFYDANLGRWMSRDPLGEAGGLNLYGFVGNSPMNFMDAWGLVYGEPFDTELEAIEDAGKYFYEISNGVNRELISWVYIGKDGKYYYTEPEPGEEAPLSEPLYSQHESDEPEGCIADVHSHGEDLPYSDDKEKVSDDDIASNASMNNLPGYVVTPRGRIIFYIPGWIDPTPAGNWK